MKRDEVVETPQNPYLLKHHEFLRLTRIHSFLPIWAHSLFAGTGVFLITLVAKFVDGRYLGGPSEISGVEWVTLAILAVLVLLFEVLVLVVPSEKKAMKKKIEAHFAAHEGE